MKVQRLYNQWHENASSAPVPVARWAVSWNPAYSESNQSLLSQYAQRAMGVDLGMATSSHRGLSEAAALFAVHLQCADHDFLADWIFSIPAACDETHVVYTFLDERLAEESGTLALAVIDALMAKHHASMDAFTADAETRLAAACQAAQRAISAGMLRSLVEARRRDIPVTRMTSGIPAYRLGYGCRQQRLWRGFTSKTSQIGSMLSTHKQLTNDVLRRLGFPVAEQRLAHDAESAKRAASQLGYPLAVKPSNTDFGVAVSAGIKDEAALLRAFEQASAHGAVLIEQHIHGCDHRMAVVDGKCIRVTRREPPQVVGNGVDTIASLIDQAAALRVHDPYLRKFKAPSLQDPLVLATLANQGLAPEDVVPSGAVVLLRTNSNSSTGGSACDITADAHPENLRLAERAAHAIGLDHAGIDYITTDISRSWREVGGGICEVNPTPYIADDDGFKRLFDYLFPNQGNGRIPIILIVGDAASARPVWDVVVAATRSAGAGRGLVWLGEASVGEWRIAAQKQATRQALNLVLADIEASMALVQIEADELVGKGLDAHYCDLCVHCGDDAELTRVAGSLRSLAGKAGRTLIRPSHAQLINALAELRIGGSVYS